MELPDMAMERSRTALFVDFDNIFLGFKQESPKAAEEFATDPARWLRWIEREMPRPGEANGASPQRSVLVRRCYLNPESFARYRAYFTRSGFSVVDCPPLTSRGKTSADIVMVMDIMDALEHATRFDEFVIMSGDADFTPVLHRLRAHDRRTAALVGGIVAPAYRAACDLLIAEDTFVEQALGLREAAEPQAAPVRRVVPVAPAELLDRIAGRVYEEASGAGSLSATDLPAVYREFPEFTPQCNWLGHFSLRALTEAVVARRTDLQMTEEDPWRVSVTGDTGNGDAPAADAGARDEMRRAIVARVAALVNASSEPVVMGRAAQEVIRAFGPTVTESRWLGHGTFKGLLTAAGELPFQVRVTPLPGFLYDAARHAPPRENGHGPALEGVREELAAFIQRVHRLTEVPRLSPRQYRLLFELLARELNRRPYSLTDTSRELRDQLVERGETINRQSASFVVKGLLYSGYRYQRNVPAGDVHTAGEIARQFRLNVRNLLSQAQASPSREEELLLDEWLLGAREEEGEPLHDAQPALAENAGPAPAQAPALSTPTGSAGAGSTGSAPPHPG
jgi:hypothetical protein